MKRRDLELAADTVTAELATVMTRIDSTKWWIDVLAKPIEKNARPSSRRIRRTKLREFKTDLKELEKKKLGLLNAAACIGMAQLDQKKERLVKPYCPTCRRFGCRNKSKRHFDR